MMSESVLVVVFIVTILSVYPAYSQRRTGLYYDNELDQTVIDQDLTSQDSHSLELEVLDLLGLPNRPRRGVDASLKKSAPRFLMDIYKSLLEKNGQEDDDDEDKPRTKRSSDDLNLSGDEKEAITESDIIMTFESINHKSGVRHERGKRLWFNVSEIPIENEIVGAELRIFQNVSYSNASPENKYTVSAYQLVQSDVGERELEFISAVNTTAGFSGWLELNVTGCLATWVALPDSNKGIYLSVHPADKPAHEVRPEEIGLVTVKGEDEMQPFTVAFLKATTDVKAVRRTTRDVRRVRKSDYTMMMKSTADSSASPSWRSCKIHTLYISFKDLKWQDWIIAPDGYAAYYCAGECNFPLNAHMNATNHAIVQTLVHLMSPLKYPKPCCAPTKLTPISVLYFYDESNVVLKKYKKMAVKSCGCH